MKYSTRRKVVDAEQFVSEHNRWPECVRIDIRGEYYIDRKYTHDQFTAIRNGDYIVTDGTRRYVIPREQFERDYERCDDA